jgi:hypothetical protein
MLQRILGQVKRGSMIALPITLAVRARIVDIDQLAFRPASMFAASADRLFPH